MFSYPSLIMVRMRRLALLACAVFVFTACGCDWPSWLPFGRGRGRSSWSSEPARADARKDRAGGAPAASAPGAVPGLAAADAPAPLRDALAALRSAAVPSPELALTGGRFFDGRARDGVLGGGDAVAGRELSPAELRTRLSRYRTPARQDWLKPVPVPAPPSWLAGPTAVSDLLVSTLDRLRFGAEECEAAVTEAIRRTFHLPARTEWNGGKAYLFARAYDRDRVGLQAHFREVAPVASWPLSEGTILDYGPGCIGFNARDGHIEVVRANVCRGRVGAACPSVPVRYYENATRTYRQIRAAAAAGCVRAFQPYERR
jgi:hypothetical protein